VHKEKVTPVASHYQLLRQLLSIFLINMISSFSICYYILLARKNFTPKTKLNYQQMKKIKFFKILLILFVFVFLQSCDNTSPDGSKSSKPETDLLPTWNEGQNKTAILEFVKQVIVIQQKLVTNYI